MVGLLLCISVGVYLAWETFAFLFRQRVLMQQALAIESLVKKSTPTRSGPG